MCFLSMPWLQLNFPLFIPTVFYPRLEEGLGCCRQTGWLGPPRPRVKLFRCPLRMGFIQVRFTEVAFCRNKPLTCSKTLCMVAYGIYLAADKIFFSNALGKQMSEAEIQIVFANGNAVAKECINRYSLGGKFLSFM